MRPSQFFNLEDLHFGGGLSRVLPGLFVTVGLFLTFLGLFSALHAMNTAEGVSEEAMTNLLTVASAKFIMSLTGLACSIMLEEAIAEGRGHRFWLLTTYTTLTNYHHSLARIPFAAAVFDEIQALKNPATLRSFAARAIRADFRIGLTGTPIENRTCDLWAVMDQLVPGALGTLSEFNDRYADLTRR